MARCSHELHLSCCYAQLLCLRYLIYEFIACCRTPLLIGRHWFGAEAIWRHSYEWYTTCHTRDEVLIVGCYLPKFAFWQICSFDCLFFCLSVLMKDIAQLTNALTYPHQMSYTALLWVSDEPYWFCNRSTKHTCQNVNFGKSSPLRVRFDFAVTLIIHHWTPAQHQPYCSGIRTVLNKFYIT